MTFNNYQTHSRLLQ